MICSHSASSENCWKLSEEVNAKVFCHYNTNSCCQRHGLSHLPRLLTRWRHRLPHLHHECWLLIGLLEVVWTNHSHVGPDLKTLGLECLQLSVQFVPLLLHIL